MANRKKYAEIKNRKNYLPDFAVSWGRLPEHLQQTNQEVAGLQIAKTAVGRYRFYREQIAMNSPLIIGQKYKALTDNLDDFTNVGQIPGNDSIYFIATGTTPNVWETGVVYEITDTVEIFYNDIDPLLELKSIGVTNSDVIITNSSFLVNKTYTTQSDGDSVQITDNNNIKLYYEESSQPSSDPEASYNYFKIEVYV
jgi:hypothetical protein